MASIGVRGGIATIKQGPKGTEAVLGFGHMTVTNLCAGGGVNCSPKTVVISRPGYGVFVAGPDQPPTSPSRVSADDLTRMNGQLGSRGGQSGGTATQPTDAQAASYQVGTQSSPIATLPNTAVARRANALAAIATATQQNVQQAAQVGATVNTAQNVIIQQQLAPKLPPSPPPSPPTPPAGPTNTYAILTTGPYSTSSGTSPVPYLTGAFAGTGTFTVSPILGYQAGGLTASGATNTTSRQFQAGLSVAGQGPTQNTTSVRHDV